MRNIKQKDDWYQYYIRALYSAIIFTLDRQKQIKFETFIGEAAFRNCKKKHNIFLKRSDDLNDFIVHDKFDLKDEKKAEKHIDKVLNETGKIVLPDENCIETALGIHNNVHFSFVFKLSDLDI